MASVAVQASWSLTWMQTLKTAFLVMRLICCLNIRVAEKQMMWVFDDKVCGYLMIKDSVGI